MHKLKRLQPMDKSCIFKQTILSTFYCYVVGACKSSDLLLSFLLVQTHFEGFKWEQNIFNVTQILFIFSLNQSKVFHTSWFHFNIFVHLAILEKLLQNGLPLILYEDRIPHTNTIYSLSGKENFEHLDGYHTQYRNNLFNKISSNQLLA